MNLYAFDVDECLVISNGPVTLESLEELRAAGNIVGVCGNMGVFCQLPDWHKRVSFLGQGYVPKHLFLHNLRQNIKADRYIMVGNVFGRTNSLGFVCGSHDSEEAAMVGFEFIVEDDFAKGVR